MTEHKFCAVTTRRKPRQRAMSGEPSPVRMRTIAAHSGAAYEAGQLGHRNGAAPEV